MKRYQYKQVRAYSSLASVAVIIVLLTVLVFSGFINNSGVKVKPTPTNAVDINKTIEPSVTEKAPDTNKVKIQLAGDLVLRDITLTSSKDAAGNYNFSQYFSQIKNYMDGDLKLLNLEGVIDGNGDGVYSGFPLYNYPKEVADAISYAGFNTVITANDHAFDKGVSGIKNTRAILAGKGLDFVGTYENAKQFNNYYIKNVNGIKIGILAYSDSTNKMDGAIPTDQLPYAMRQINWLAKDASLAAMKKDIEGCKAAGAEIVLVSLHWGKDLLDAPDADQRWLAQNLVESGADIIMGTLSHCLQPVTYKQIKTTSGETKQVVIAYSLGNFFSHQTNKTITKTQDGMILNINIERDAQGKAVIVNADYLPTYIYSWDISTSTKTSVYNYQVLAAGAYNKDTTKPAIFFNDADWKKSKDAFAYAQKIVGNASGKLKALDGIIAP